MPCSLVNISSTFEENDCFETRKKKKKKVSKGETSIWGLYNRAFFQVFCSEGNNLYRNTYIYQIIRIHFPEEKKIIVVSAWPTSSHMYASYCTTYCS